jgi:hypothetical protein
MIELMKGILFACLISLAILTGCDPDDPQKEDVPELITKITLSFQPSGGGAAVIASATDPDGMGIQPIEVDGSIDLAANTSYILSVQMINQLANPSDPLYNVTDEVEEEGDEHLFFFSWTNNVFSDPSGDGNIDSRSDDMNYEDEDVNGLPIGLSTSWTTTDVVAAGTFRMVLKHQPDIKSAESSSTTGETDLDIHFTINVQ